MATTIPVTDTSKPKELEFFSYDLFGCFEDFGLCIFTFILPCYTAGRNAEALGEDGCVIGLLYGLGFAPALGPLMRWRIRDQNALRGNMITDVMLHCFLPCCSLIQENRQLYGGAGSHAGEKIPINQDMQRK